MIRVSVFELRPGMVLAAPLYGADGVVWLHAGVTLKASYIQRLRELGFTGVYVRDGVADDVVPQGPLSEQTRQMAIATMRQVFQELGAASEPGRLQPLRDLVHRMLDELWGQTGVAELLGQVRSADDYTFAHSVDVGVLAVLAGMALGYSRPRLFELAMGALLHDVGKVQVQRSLLTKPAALTPEETAQMQLHTVYGFEMLKGRLDISAASAHVAYQHHERSDGSGYPRGLKEPAIHPLAQVVAAVDVFDAMTADRPYRRGLPAHQVAAFLERQAGRQFNPVVVERFLSRVPLYATGTAVRLNTGETAVVVSQNRAHRGRPVVRLLTRPDGRPLRRPVDVDLLNERNRHIVGVTRWAPPAGSDGSGPRWAQQLDGPPLVGGSAGGHQDG